MSNTNSSLALKRRVFLEVIYKKLLTMYFQNKIKELEKLENTT